MKIEYPNLTIVDKDYLQELEQFKKDRDLIYDLKLSYEDIVNIDTYKHSFTKFLQVAQLSIANQRALSQGKERELWGAFEEVGKLIDTVKKIDTTRLEYDKKKEEKQK